MFITRLLKATSPSSKKTHSGVGTVDKDRLERLVSEYQQAYKTAKGNTNDYALRRKADELISAIPLSYANIVRQKANFVNDKRLNNEDAYQQGIINFLEGIVGQGEKPYFPTRSSIVKDIKTGKGAVDPSTGKVQRKEIAQDYLTYLYRNILQGFNQQRKDLGDPMVSPDAADADGHSFEIPSELGSSHDAENDDTISTELGDVADGMAVGLDESDIDMMPAWLQKQAKEKGIDVAPVLTTDFVRAMDWLEGISKKTGKPLPMSVDQLIQGENEPLMIRWINESGVKDIPSDLRDFFQDISEGEFDAFGQQLENLTGSIPNRVKQLRENTFAYKRRLQEELKNYIEPILSMYPDENRRKLLQTIIKHPEALGKVTGRVGELASELYGYNKDKYERYMNPSEEYLQELYEEYHDPDVPGYNQTAWRGYPQRPVTPKQIQSVINFVKYRQNVANPTDVDIRAIRKWLTQLDPNSIVSDDIETANKIKDNISQLIKFSEFRQGKDLPEMRQLYADEATNLNNWLDANAHKISDEKVTAAKKMIERSRNLALRNYRTTGGKKRGTPESVDEAADKVITQLPAIADVQPDEAKQILSTPSTGVDSVEQEDPFEMFERIKKENQNMATEPIEQEDPFEMFERIKKEIANRTNKSLSQQYFSINDYVSHIRLGIRNT